jgi:hypothetical protein
MPTYDVTSRKTMPIEVNSVTADSREAAISQTVEAAGEGESVEVMNVVETSADEATPQSRK